MAGDVNWPWRLNDDRPHGWFTANGLTKFGPLPKREAREAETWPPADLEPALNVVEFQKRHGQG